MSLTQRMSLTKQVIVIGAGLTGLTTAFWLRRAGIDVCVLETANRVGGQIHSYRYDGFVYESGPNTGAISHPEVVELFEALAPDCTLITAREAAKARWIWKGNRFHALPSGLLTGLTTSLFSWRDKLCLLGEPFRRRGTDPNETVGALTVRRLGRTFLRNAVDPFLSGVYAGDPMRLVTRFALPKLYALEQEYGSFLRGAVKKARQPKTERERLATKQVFSAQGGMESLVHTLAERVGRDRIVLNAQQVVLQPPTTAGNLWSVTFEQEGQLITMKAPQVITTCPAYALPSLLPFVEETKMQAVSSLYYAPIIQVAVCLNDTAEKAFAAFGGLVPSAEAQPVLGILFPSSCFEGRAPQGGAVFSVFIGGVRHAEMLDSSDEEMAEIIDDVLHRMLRLPAEVKPAHLGIFRHPRAIPQYEASSEQRLAAVETLETAYPGLTLAGNLRDGIGMADRIRQGATVARHVASACLESYAGGV